MYGHMPLLSTGISTSRPYVPAMTGAPVFAAQFGFTGTSSGGVRDLERRIDGYRGGPFGKAADPFNDLVVRAEHALVDDPPIAIESTCTRWVPGGPCEVEPEETC